MTVCDCCGRGEDVCTIRAPLAGWQESYHLPAHICSDCLAVWYDQCITDPDEIKRRVLARASAPALPGP